MTEFYSMLVVVFLAGVLVGRISKPDRPKGN